MRKTIHFLTNTGFTACGLDGILHAIQAAYDPRDVTCERCKKTEEYAKKMHGPGEEDGPWAEGWRDRSALQGQTVQVVKSWDALPPVVFEQGLRGLAYSTRALERQHRQMKEALEQISHIGLGRPIGDARQIAAEALKEVS